MHNSRASGDAMSSDDRTFDASQYAFFGKEIGEDAELGRIEEEENYDFAPAMSDDEFHFSSVGDKELAEAYASLSHIDDLSSIYAKLNRAVSDPARHTGIIGDRSSFSRDSSCTTEWMQESEMQNWSDPNLNNNNNNKIWLSNPLTKTNSNPLMRTSSSPNQNAPHHYPQNFLNNNLSPLTESNSSPLMRTSSSPNQNQPRHHPQKVLNNSLSPLTESNSSPLMRTSSSPNQNPPRHHSQNFLQNNLSSLTESDSSPLMRTSSSPNQNPPRHHSQNFLTKPSPLTESNSSPLIRTSSSPNQNPLHHHPQYFFAPLTESNSKPLLRTSSSPNENPPHQHHQNFLNKPKFVPQTLNLTRHLSTPSLSPLLQNSIYGNLNLNLNSVGDLSNLSNFSNFSNFSSGSGQGHNRLLPNLLLQQQQQMLLNPNSYPNYNSNFPNLHPFNPYASNSNTTDQRLKNTPNKNKQKDRFAPDTNNNNNNNNNNNSLPQFKSKYMSSEEIQNIHKIQHNISHNNNNPYLTDYYHQACLYKRGVKCPFYPSSLKEVTNTNSKSRASTETLSFLPPTRNPKSLLERENLKNKPLELERETMVSVRIIIEDSLSLLLDVDDIDRTIQQSVPNDGGYQLKKRRQILLETLASSLQLSDPLKPNDSSDPFDRVFLLIISLPKGRELVSRFLKLVPAGTDLSRIICMAVFRHLRFLFGSSSETLTLVSLSKTVSESVSKFELSALSACLAAVVCSNAKPPLRPIGCLAGDFASVALKSVLDKGTEILLSGEEFSVSSRVLWQASFDAFFGLLCKYCMEKYERCADMASDEVAVLRGEMPVELLRASLPHTNEQQRKVLIDFVKQSMVDPVHGGPGSCQSG